MSIGKWIVVTKGCWVEDSGKIDLIEPDRGNVEGGWKWRNTIHSPEAFHITFAVINERTPIPIGFFRVIPLAKNKHRLPAL